LPPSSLAHTISVLAERITGAAAWAVLSFPAACPTEWRQIADLNGLGETSLWLSARSSPFLSWAKNINRLLPFRRPARLTSSALSRR
jgi:hypothetical protein